MSNTHAHHPSPEPLGGSLVTPTTVILAALVGVAFLILAVRFLFGLGDRKSVV